MKHTKLFILVILLGTFLGVWFFSQHKKITENIANSIVTPSSHTLVYKNTPLGFTLTLRESWRGYTESTEKVEYGYLVTLMHPLSTPENPRMNIPIYVYPIEQWEAWQKNDFEGYQTAAPFGPTERGRNTKYVFTTAPRYNYSFMTGWEEVEEIIKTLKGI